jgi:hypothetical protein
MAHAPSRRRVVRSVSQSVFISKEGVSVSLWSATSKEPSIPALDKNIYADVCIVGAGIAGMTTAAIAQIESIVAEGKIDCDFEHLVVCPVYNFTDQRLSFSPWAGWIRV